MDANDVLVQSQYQEIRRGSIVIAVLSLLRTPQYGYALLEDLNGAGIEVEANTLYPLLRRLETQGWLDAAWTTDGARPRKYYQTSDAGRSTLGQMIDEWQRVTANLFALVGKGIAMNDMIDRYLAAALNGMPQSRRAEVMPEIRGAIAEMVQVRIASGEPESEAVRQALTELGDPVRFAASYQDKPRMLIGPDWYPSYIRTLKLVPSIVLPVIAAIVLLVEMGVDGASLGPALLSVAAAVLQTAIVTLFAVTLGFAIAERVGSPSDAGIQQEPWTPDDLPELAVSRRVSLGSTIGAIVTALVFGGLVLIQARRGMGFFASGISDDLQDASLINPDIPAGWSWAFFGLILFTIAVAIIRYLGRVWNGTALVLTLVDSLLWCVYIVALAVREPILSPALGERIDAGGDWWQAGGQLNSAIAIVVILATLPDLWEAWQGFRENRQRT